MNDLISRQDALKGFAEYSDGWCYINALPSVQPTERCIATITLTDEQVKEGFEEAKRKILAEQPKQRWIPCSERLPKEDEEVLVYLYGNMPFIAWTDSGRWCTEDYLVDEDDEPIAWMPLPHPYKGDKK